MNYECELMDNVKI